MALVDFKVDSYRSIKDVWLKLNPVNVVVGANGSGKTNLYRAMYILKLAARGDLARALNEEGGIASALYAGARKDFSKRAAFRISVRVDKFEYNLECGFSSTLIKSEHFSADPEVKKEEVYFIENGSRHMLLDRRRRSIMVWNALGKKLDYTNEVRDNDSVLSNLSDPRSFPELYTLRDEFLSWRFYHHFRTDLTSPLRKPQVGTFTRALSDDARDLAAMLASIIEFGRSDELFDYIDQAFPGSNLAIDLDSRGRFCISMQFPGFARPFQAHELSDGTLQFLCLLAALLPVEPASLIAINEPETSLHPQLIAPLSRLIVDSAKTSQIWLTTHSRELADYVFDKSGYEPWELTKKDGATKLVGVGLGGYRDETDETEETDEENPEDQEDEA